ncbi:hypothetical protein [Streptomyces sp. NPDC057702]|uniref:hypothetical protein n=1 Tax=unclassified Streptomyces TaxID=2593676 RepID=UPI0036872F07
MTSTPDLRDEDQANFDRVLRQALATAEIRASLRQGVHTTVITDWLRERVEEGRAEIAAHAAPEYARHLRARDAVAGASTASRSGRGPLVGPLARARRRLLPALAVLAPLLATMAAVVFLLLGYVLEAADSGPELADALVRAGWAAAVIALLTGAVAAAALLVTALRHRSAPLAGPDRAARSAAADRAREDWQRALLERGMIPFLRARLREREQPGPGQRAERRPPRSRIGYASPDYASPDFSGPRADRHDADA